MSESKNEYIEINLGRMMMGLLVSIYKNGKVFLATLVCALVLTVAVSYMMTRNTYVYKQMIQTPSYFDGKGAQNTLDNTKINVILQSMFKQIQDSNPDLKVFVTSVIRQYKSES